jgi:hypothetical protein
MTISKSMVFIPVYDTWKMDEWITEWMCWLPKYKLDILLIWTIVKTSASYGPVLHYYEQILKYSRTPLIWINWDGESSRYAENLHNWIFLWKQATLPVPSSSVTIYCMYLHLNLSTTSDLKFLKIITWSSNWKFQGKLVLKNSRKNMSERLSRSG